MENKQRIEELRKEELVEERSPNYTMKGRYNHGSIFDK